MVVVGCMVVVIASVVGSVVTDSVISVETVVVVVSTGMDSVAVVVVVVVSGCWFFWSM